MSEAEGKLREQIASEIAVSHMQKKWQGQYYIADQILNLIKEAGYLPVEPVQLEVLGDEDAEKAWVKHWNGNRVGYRAISQATITHNEAKGQLYRVKGD